MSLLQDAQPRKADLPCVPESELSMNRVWFLTITACTIASLNVTLAGPFRRYPAGSERAGVPRIATRSSAAADGAVSAPDSLPPMPRDAGESHPRVTENNDRYMEALERTPGCSVSSPRSETTMAW